MRQIVVNLPVKDLEPGLRVRSAVLRRKDAIYAMTPRAVADATRSTEVPIAVLAKDTDSCVSTRSKIPTATSGKSFI